MKNLHFLLLFACLLIGNTAFVIAQGCSITGASGYCDGVISPVNLTAEITSLSSPFSYLWSTGETTKSISVSQVSIYTVTITDSFGNNCTASKSLVILSPIEITYNIEHVGDNQIVHFQISGGLPSYQNFGGYSIGTPPFYATYDPVLGYAPSDLTLPCNSDASSYFMVNSDGSSCNNFILFTLIPNCTTLGCDYHITGNSFGCSNELTTLTAEGTGLLYTPLTYLWNTGETTQSINTNISGDYSVTITNPAGNSCIANFLLTIYPPLDIAYSVEATGTEQIVHFQTTGGFPAYQQNGFYLTNWFPNTIMYYPDLGYAPFDLSFPCYTNNTFQFVITGDAFGCKDSIAFSLTPNCLSNIVITPSPTPISSCNTCNGAIDISVTGGTAPYTYQWNTGANFPNMVNLCSGTYTITVTDANNNISSASVVVNAPTAPLVSLSNINNCAASSAVLDPGNNFASYFWNTGTTTPTLTITSSGTYTVTVTAANNCTATAQSIATINCGAPVCNYTIAGNNVICQGQSTTLNVLGLGLTPPLSYLWNNSQTTASITVSTAGIYAVIVSDMLGNSCQAATILVVNPTPNFGVLNNCNVCVDCFDCNNAPFNYIWSNGETDACLANPLAGIYYTVTITDALGCSSTLSDELMSNLINIEAVNVLAACNGNNGSICITVTGGAAPYTYFITNSMGELTFLGDNSCADNLIPDTYIIVATGANGCNASIVVPVDAQPIVISSQTYSCNEPSITFTAPDGFVSYQWSTGETTNSIVVTDYTQTYNLTVTTANGCTAVSNYNVTEVASPIVNLSDALACNGETITLDAGTEGVTYQWSTGETTTTIDVANAGWYYVSVTNFVGCTTTDSAFVSVDCNLYPGDANNDGEANYIDLLSIGNNFGNSGAARIEATNNWAPQQVTYWGTNAANGMDLSYSDCNGDGTVNAADTTVIALNYGNQHQSIIVNAPQNISINFRANPANEGFIDSETAIIPFDVVVTNDNNTPLSDIYGIGFKLHYTSPVATQLGVKFDDITNGWSSYLGSALSNNPDEQILTLARNFITSDTTGELHIALTKINEQGIAGSLAGVCRVIATVNIETWGIKQANNAANSPIPIALTFDNVLLTAANGTTYQQTVAVQDTIYIPTIPTGIKPIAHNLANWVLYPNPASNYATIFIQLPISNNQPSAIYLYDVTGKLVLSKNILPNQNSLSFSTTNLLDGLYYCWYNNTVQKLIIGK